MDKFEIKIGKKTAYYQKFDVTSIICEEYLSDNGSKASKLRMKLSGISNLMAGNKIRITRNMKDELLNRDSKIVKEYKIIESNCDGNEICIEYPGRDTLILKKITFPEEGEKYFTLEFDRDPEIFQEDIWKQDGRSDYGVYPSNNLKLEVSSKRTFCYLDGLAQYNETITEYKKNGCSLSDEMFNPLEIFCYNFNKNILEGATCRFSDTFFAYGTNKYLDDEKTEEIYSLYNPEDTEFSVLVDYINLPVVFKQTNCPGIWQEDLISSYFLNEVKEKSIPDTIDMEKICFEPYHIERGTDTIQITPINEIIIYPHFRKRSLDGWNTDDNLWWNACEYNKGLFVDLDKSESGEKRGDRFSDMNFTLNDIKYQKNKLKQSFIRLSFYDKNDPLSQQLLYYSTVFMDTGKLFGEYTSLKNEIYNTSTSVIDDKPDEKISNELRCQFSITDRHNISKSSEGFYLYLFPSLIEELYKKNVGSPIYMKIEFNHAGVGKTIPLVLPKDGIPPKDYSKQVGVSGNGEVKAVFWENDMKSYYEDLYIKLFIEYVPEIDKYVYRFGDRVTYKENGRVAEFNVFEPKMNSDGDN